MSDCLALYGFVRKKDGLNLRASGVEKQSCSLLDIGNEAAAVVSTIQSKTFQPNPQDLVRHDEVVAKIFKRQVILPAKFPKIMFQETLEKSMSDMAPDLNKVLRRVYNKCEYQIRVITTDPISDETSMNPLNYFSRHVMENAHRYQYKHYFPLLTKEGKEAEFVDYAEAVVKQISSSLCRHTTYWRGKSFQSDKVLLKSYFWVRKSKRKYFEQVVDDLKNSFPNLKFNVLGPTAPYNFVQLEFADSL